MTADRPDLLIVLSAPPEIGRRELVEILAAHDEVRVTIYLRDADRDEYADLIEGYYVRSDKPTQGKARFLSELRTTLYDEAIVLDFGHWSFFTARCLFFLARAQVKRVRTERGEFRFSFLAPITLLGHWLHRRKHRSGSVAGLPPGTPAPFLLAAYRKTLGLALGLIGTLLEYGWRRLFRTSV